MQTSDARIFPNGTGYVTDIGMCGAVDSILGVKTECIIKKFKTKMPVRFETATGSTELNGAVFTFDTCERRVVSVELLKRNLG